jgi:hypothetical protein
MRRVAVAVALAIAARGQQQPAARVEFEVVSVKPGDAVPTSSGVRTTGGLGMKNITLKFEAAWRAWAAPPAAS